MSAIEPLTVDVRVDMRLVNAQLAWLRVRLAMLTALVNAATWLRSHVGECLVYLAFLGGWILLTAGVAQLWRPTAWFFSLGLLLLSLGGIKPLALMAWNGLYVLMARDE